MWLEIVDRLLKNLDRSNHFIEALHFFIYDSVKILFLLVTIIFVITLMRSYFPVEKIRDYLARKNKIIGHILASLFGIVTPFCSCSAVPLFLGFLQARIPLGVTFSYLVSAPMNNEIAIAMLFALFGWKTTAVYIALGLFIAITSGLIIGFMNLEKEVLLEIAPSSHTYIEQKIDFKQRMNEAWVFTIDLLKKVYLYILLGVGFGSLIHGFIPNEFITQIAGGNSWYTVPLATLFGIPMYSNAAGVMPLIEVLTQKGMLLGTALSFMMAIIALSLPEAMILKRVLSLKLLGIFFGVVGLGIMVVGYVFNMII